VRYLALVLAAIVVLLAVAAAGVYVWARNNTDDSLFARALIWGESDVDDWKRFPSRPVHASSDPVTFSSAENPMSFPAIDGRPFDSFLEDSNTTAFIALHGDDLLYEGYYNETTRESTQTSFSVAKSFASTLIGIALEEGYISSLNDPVTHYVPELLERDERFAGITLRHLITMSSGLRYREARYFWEGASDDPTKTYYSPDLRSTALGSKIEEAPGARFLYNNYNPLLIGMVLERSTGMSVSEYLETRLWQPMGAEADGSWSLDSEKSGFEKMESGVNGRAIDLVKLGWLFLNEGRNGERQVVPAAWVEEATRPDTTTDPALDYQYFWWVDVGHDAYYAEGNYCQFIYVYPDAELVLLRTGRDCGGAFWTGILRDLADWLKTRVRE
jgi:CubicO group peptidase (beta-lactamase class C family)